MRILAVSAMFAVAASAAQAEEKRSADAHEHGHSQLRIAVEGDELLMEIEAPGADITGFEHEPASDEDHAAMDAGIAALKDAAGLFMPSAAAKCDVEHVEVHAPYADEEHDGEDHDGDKHGHSDHDDDHGDEKHADEHDHEGEAHSEFTAEYHFECGDIGALTELRTTWFEKFPNAEELDVEMILPSGAGAQELDASNPVVSLSL